MKIQIVKVVAAICVLLGALSGIYFIIQEAGEEKQRNIGFTTFENRGVVFDMVLSEDVLYAATVEGVLRFSTGKAENYGLLEDLGNVSYARAIVLDNNGRLWIGHEKGITVYNTADRTVRIIDEESGLPDNRVTSLCRGEQESVWAGTWGGAVCIDKVPGKITTRSNGLLDNMVSEIFLDSKGGLWCGSAVAPRGGLSCLYQGQWRYCTTKNGLPHNSINDIYQLSDSQILVGTGFYEKGGVAYFEYADHGWEWKKNYTDRDGVLAGKIRSIFRDDSGILWIGYEFEGISLFKDGKSLLLTKNDGLPHNEVLKVLQDGQGNYWLATADGVAYIDKSCLLSYFEQNKN